MRAARVRNDENKSALVIELVPNSTESDSEALEGSKVDDFVDHRRIEGVDFWWARFAPYIRHR